MPAKQTTPSQIRLSERREIITGMSLHKLATGNQQPRNLLILGNGGVACHELGEVVGVCAEAPLPHILVKEQKLLLDGVCGIASMLKYWGLAPITVCPAGRAQTSSLQQRLLAEQGLPSLALCTSLPQVVRYTRRVFAGGHQLAHIETEESILPASAREIKTATNSLLGKLKQTDLLCIVDKGHAGLSEEIISKLVAQAKTLNARILYEPRGTQLFSSNFFDIVKINHNQISQWFGPRMESDRDALAVAKLVLSRTRANSVIYTRGARGILVCQRSGTGHEAFLIASAPKKLFDLMSAGDIVTAALAFCIAKGCSLLQSACFAAAAAELSLDQRYDKLFDIQAILNASTHVDESRHPHKAK
jgi:D-beta-D-heptose 7-phosphate kinase/D-beta-D-heptose 1-phosphate adenosyltransferase